MTLGSSDLLFYTNLVGKIGALFLMAVLLCLLIHFATFQAKTFQPIFKDSVYLVKRIHKCNDDLDEA